MSALVVVVLLLLACGALLRGVERPRAAWWAGWLLLPGGLALASWLSRDDPAPWRFVAGTGALFFALKIIAHAAWRRDGAAPLPWHAWLAYCLLWIGMNPGPFAQAQRRGRRDSRRALVRGLGGLLVGAAAWLALACLWQTGAPPWLVHAGQLLGVYGALRFGADPLVAGLLRTRGILVTTVFRAPEVSRSLGEFWSRRWNRPFSEMLQLIAERPLRRRVGRRGAQVGTFLLSGLLHEASISLPVRGGFGLPTAYFLLQLMLVGLERRSGLLERWPSWARRAWTLAWAVGPAVLVFHPPFLAAVLAPLLGPRG